MQLSLLRLRALGSSDPSILRALSSLASPDIHLWSGCDARQFSNEHATSSSTSDTLRLPASLPTFLIFGANTGVGKTLVSAGLARATTRAKDPLFYVKPVQTGFPEDSDGALVARASGASHSLGPHAAFLDPSGASCLPRIAPTPAEASTLFCWAEAVGPHVAALREGRPVTDEELRAAVATQLQAFAARHADSVTSALALVETAGGVCSPAPSGRLAADSFRPFRMPSLLVADGRLGGISTSIAALESLLLRGYDTAAVVLLSDARLGNVESLRAYLADRRVPVITLPEIRPHSGKVSPTSGLELHLEEWLERSAEPFAEIRGALGDFHATLRSARARAPARAQQMFWWPFTQHQNVDPGHVTVIDSRCGDDFLVYEPAAPPALRPLFDGCASWWTQGVSTEHHGTLARGLAYAAGRYGHVMFPENSHGAALQAAERLLGAVGDPWASRVFFSDDGSTAIEIALKMAFRKALQQAGRSADDLLQSETAPLDIHVLGLTNAYHGDTLGAMDAVPPSVFNRTQFPAWYKGRGLFFDPPTAALVKGTWTVTLPDSEGWGGGLGKAPMSMPMPSRDHLFDWTVRDASPLAETYRAHIRARIDAHGSGSTTPPPVFGALILEPVLQGAGGMVFLDPLFQRVLVQEARRRGIPVIFDEVFTGLYRLGVASAWRLLGEQPDIACYAKLLTGGSVPLAATVTSEAIFALFKDKSKLNALLHGHSYSAHALGCQAASAALALLSNPATNPNFRPKPTAREGETTDDAPSLQASCKDFRGGRCCAEAADPGYALEFCACRAAEGTVGDLWDPTRVAALSMLPSVARALSMGSVCAFEMHVGGAGGGYASSGAAEIVRGLRAAAGVYARPLGNVVYLMAAPMTPRARCDAILGALEELLRKAGSGRGGATSEDLVP